MTQPNADEIQRAEEWCRSKYGDWWFGKFSVVNAFATALAECREAMEFMRALKRRHNGYSRECRDALSDLKEPSTPDEAITELMEEAAELATMAERERYNKIIDGLIYAVKSANALGLGDDNGRVAVLECAAAAIRGGGQ